MLREAFASPPGRSADEHHDEPARQRVGDPLRRLHPTAVQQERRRHRRAPTGQAVEQHRQQLGHRVVDRLGAQPVGDDDDDVVIAR